MSLVAITKVWRLDQQYTFAVLKLAITKTLVLVSPDTSILFRIEADSLDFATRIVLFQWSKEDSK